MKIAFVINKSWNIYNFRLSLIKALQAIGHEIIAIAPVDEYSQKLVDQGCTFIPIEVESRGLNPIADYKLYSKLVSIFKNTQPDCILSYTIKPNIYSALAARKLKIPIICNVTGLGTVFIRKNPIYIAAHWLYRIALDYPQKVYFQNNDDYELFTKLNLVHEYKAEMVPGSGVNLNRFFPQDKKTQTPFTFLLVSRILKDKGINEYIEAIKILKNKGLKANFQLLGSVEDSSHSGITREMIDNWVNMGLIQYHGFTDDVVHYYHQADCVVLPSYREGMPKSLLEAMAVGKPIITTNVPGCRELVKNNSNGILCEPKNSESLVSAIETICNFSPEILKQMGKESRKMVLDTYDEKFIIFKYITTIHSITRKNGI
jgi:glycosyltransferase involved in cell wall biosynthesis